MIDFGRQRADGIPGLAALASLKRLRHLAQGPPRLGIPGLAALASLKLNIERQSRFYESKGFRGLLPWPH